MAVDTDDDLAVAATTVLSALSDKIKRKRKRDKWAQPWIAQRPISGAYHALLHELQATDAKRFRGVGSVMKLVEPTGRGEGFGCHSPLPIATGVFSRLHALHCVSKTSPTFLAVTRESIPITRMKLQS